MTSNNWIDSLEKILRKQGSPVIERINDLDNSIEILSAANIWTLALERKKKLRHQGLRPGDILCESSDSSELIVNLVAAAMGKFIYWPIKKSEINKFLQNSEESVQNFYLIDRGLTSKVKRPEINCNFITPETVLLLSTSGTTGKERVIGFTATSLLHQIENINKGLQCKEESGRLIVLPLHHCFGLILDFLAGLFAKQQLHIRNTGFFSPEKILKAITQNDITHLSLVPRMLDLMIIYSEKNPEVVKFLKKIEVHVGGAVISENLKNKALNIFGGFIEGYGLTECAGGVLLNGKPNGCEVRLKPINGTEPNIFELWIKSVSLGHFTNQEEWNDSEGFFQTMDLVEVKNNGEYRVLGRSGSLIKTTQGVWTQISDIEEIIKKIFSLEFIHLEKIEGCLNILISTNNFDIKLIQYIEKNYGLDCKIINFQSNDSLEKILISSQKKSASEAVSEWYKKNSSLPLSKTS